VDDQLHAFDMQWSYPVFLAEVETSYTPTKVNQGWEYQNKHFRYVFNHRTQSGGGNVSRTSKIKPLRLWMTKVGKEPPPMGGKKKRNVRRNCKGT
jgi:hypothetical protein